MDEITHLEEKHEDQVHHLESKAKAFYQGQLTAEHELERLKVDFEPEWKMSPPANS